MAELLVEIQTASRECVAACERGDIDAACTHGDHMMMLVRENRRIRLASLAELRRALAYWDYLKDEDPVPPGVPGVLDIMRGKALADMLAAIRAVLA